jgi:hypothetical protein
LIQMKVWILIVGFLATVAWLALIASHHGSSR